MVRGVTLYLCFMIASSAAAADSPVPSTDSDGLISSQVNIADTNHPQLQEIRRLILEMEREVAVLKQEQLAILARLPTCKRTLYHTLSLPDETIMSPGFDGKIDCMYEVEEDLLSWVSRMTEWVVRLGEVRSRLGALRPALVAAMPDSPKPEVVATLDGHLERLALIEDEMASSQAHVTDLKSSLDSLTKLRETHAQALKQASTDTDKARAYRSWTESFIHHTDTSAEYSSGLTAWSATLLAMAESIANLSIFVHEAAKAHADTGFSNPSGIDASIIRNEDAGEGARREDSRWSPWERVDQNHREEQLTLSPLRLLGTTDSGDLVLQWAEALYRSCGVWDRAERPSTRFTINKAGEVISVRFQAGPLSDTEKACLTTSGAQGRFSLDSEGLVIADYRP